MLRPSKSCWSALACALLIVLLPQGAQAAAFDGRALGFAWAVPFVGILLSIALFPLLAPHFWEHHQGKISAFWAALVLIPMALVYGVGTAAGSLVHTALLEYIPFILLLLALFLYWRTIPEEWGTFDVQSLVIDALPFAFVAMGQSVVINRHALKNAALPALTVTGLIVGQLFSGTVVTETVFSRPGLGRVTATAVQGQDIPVVQGIVLVAAAIFVVANLVVDLVYPLLDPRVVLAGSRRKLREQDGATPGATPSDATEPKAVPA